MSAAESSEDIKTMMLELGKRARGAARRLSIADPQSKNLALEEAAAAIDSAALEILAANEEDVRRGTETRLSTALLDRLRLNEKRVAAISNALREIARLPDPVGQTIAQFERPNGLLIDRVRTPLGVIGVVYESRPNVTADAGALCLKAGNASILRGGSDSSATSKRIHQCLVDGLMAADLNPDCIQLVTTHDRQAVGEMLAGLNGNLDVLIPRGGKSLVARVQAESRVPVFAHLEGICHTYVEKSARLDMAKSIVINAKMRRTGICGATETLLIDRDCLDTHLLPIIAELVDAGCEIRGDQEVCNHSKEVHLAQECDWSTEYLDSILSIKVVSGIEEAIDHIANYSSHHTEAVVTENEKLARRFLEEVDSAIVMHNASTQFADGGEFGMGAEIGIATGKMHARGPVGVEQLTSFKYIVRGSGQTRPH